VLGYVPDDLLGSSKLEMVHPGDRPAIVEALRQMAGGGRPYLPLVRLRDAGGSWVFVEARGVAIPEDAGEPRTFLVSAHDLTDRRRAEEELLEVVRRYKTLVEHVPAITYTDAVDDQMTTLFISPQVESILGYTPDEWTADPDLWYRRLHQEDRPRALAQYLGGRDSGRPFVFEYRMLSRDGREVWFRDSATVVCDPMGQPALVHGIMVDVTELKRAEAALRTALERERVATEGLKALDLMRNTFLRAASHELRTPITISRGHLEVLGDEPDPDDVRSAIRVVIGELGRMGRIVDDITTLVRMEDPSFLRMKDVALGQFVADVAAKAGALLGGRLRLEATPAGASARADPQRLTQALLNLLQNAAVHTNGTTPVRLRVIQQPEAWRFEVADGGGGLPPGEEERVFQPFQRATSTAPGSGLGLAIVRGIAEAHGGSAGADNYPGKGVTFWVLLPR
jgi:PAS domain S-box-containing protein